MGAYSLYLWKQHKLTRSRAKEKETV